jgi:hypothetical protein
MHSVGAKRRKMVWLSGKDAARMKDEWKAAATLAQTKSKSGPGGEADKRRSHPLSGGCGWVLAT